MMSQWWVNDEYGSWRKAPTHWSTGYSPAWSPENPESIRALFCLSFSFICVPLETFETNLSIDHSNCQMQYCYTGHRLRSHVSLEPWWRRPLSFIMFGYGGPIVAQMSMRPCGHVAFHGHTFVQLSGQNQETTMHLSDRTWRLSSAWGL